MFVLVDFRDGCSINVEVRMHWGPFFARVWQNFGFLGGFLRELFKKMLVFQNRQKRSTDIPTLKDEIRMHWELFSLGQG